MQLNLIMQRIAMLDLAEKLAREDENLSNLSENLSMITRCITVKIELWGMAEELRRAA